MGADYSDIKGMWTGSETGVVDIDINLTLFRLWFVSVLGYKPLRHGVNSVQVGR